MYKKLKRFADAITRHERGELTFPNGPERAKATLSMPLLDVSTGEELKVGDLNV